MTVKSWLNRGLLGQTLAIALELTFLTLPATVAVKVVLAGASVSVPR